MFSVFSNKFFMASFFFLMMEKLILKQDPTTADAFTRKQRGFSAGCMWYRRQETSGSTGGLWAEVEWLCPLSTMSHSPQPEEDSLPDTTLDGVSRGGSLQPSQIPSFNSSAMFSRQVLINPLTQSSSGVLWEFWEWLGESCIQHFSCKCS